MSDIQKFEEAIETLKDLRIFDDDCETDCIALDLGIEALQEKAERETGCATYNKPSLFMKQHKFPCCPMCGRKLGETNANRN